MEIYGKNGEQDLSGPGGSCDSNKRAQYKMLPEMGPPKTISWEYMIGDDPGAGKIHAFMDDIRLERRPAVGLPDAYANLKIVEKIYKFSGYEPH